VVIKEYVPAVFPSPEVRNLIDPALIADLKAEGFDK
jgi:hypothetical protein